MQPVEYTADGVVTISHPTLASSPLSLGDAVVKAFGSHPESLGIILVRDLPPDYVTYRERLLKLAHKFAKLSPEVQEKYADPSSRYRQVYMGLRSSSLTCLYFPYPLSFGWSHGKEIMNGKPDTLKGSYYANPLVDKPTVSKEEIEAYPEYYGKNIWPERDEKGIEGFEEAFKDLGRFVFNVGLQVAAACQPFALPHLNDSRLSLPMLIGTSQTTKARLLHYFPPTPSSRTADEEEPIDSWCGFHLDHSMLTGLCSAIFLKENAGDEPSIVPPPSSTSGLYIRTRGGKLTKVSIPHNCLAFQTGEALSLATGGRLQATPHCVRVGSDGSSQEVSRETFALFMQPNTDQLLTPSQSFGQFSKQVFDEHYETST
ncbi:hypothetical protein M378DRAFT_64783 [Amanita muscaria Koide BX008]|uniref:Clavaminate synthase-like protein n=1 Tax=Amanita muscaria (strain Koide BX008) TaxID=946122 RepID=A0A0C2XRG6_AMAMK|nr:hypothetical protein M378DRAFT_64783 [Amanita muscaria Koide BX008]